jgi:AcrR family transcriptional regulator
MARPATGFEPTRRRLVGTTRDLIAERGVDAVELADIAARAGLTVPSLYHYFRDRWSLILEALRAEIAEMLDAASIADNADDPPGVRLRVFLEKQADYLARKGPATISFVLRSVLDSNANDELRSVAGLAFGAADGVFRQAVAELEGDDPDTAALHTDLLRACLAGMVLMRAVDAGVDNAAVSAELLARLGIERPDAIRRSG